MVIETILWRRLDTPGHDACRLEQTDSGWRVDGAAAFRHDGLPARFAYRIACNAEWRMLEGAVQGWVGGHEIDLRVGRTVDGVWMLNGREVPDLDGCTDLDLGFTPATNLFQLRRVALRVGEVAAVPVAWLDVPAGIFEVLHQRYERRTEAVYWYEAPRFNYTAFLEVRPVGFIIKYPGLWEAEP